MRTGSGRRKEREKMRRSDREIKDFDKMLEILERSDVCRIGMVDEDGMAYIVPLNYGFRVEEGKAVLYFHCANEGKKLSLIRKNPRVSFEIDGRHTLELSEEKRMCTMRYESLMGKGLIAELPEERKMEALKEIMRHYGREEFDFSQAAVPRTVLLSMTIEEMTGKTNIK